MQTLVTSTTEGTGSTRGQGNWPKGYGDTDSEFSDESDSLDAVSGVSRLGMGWNGTDVDDEEGQTANDDNVSDGMVDDVDGDITSAEPDTEIETPEIDESADPVADVIDGYFNPEHQYGWSGHPRRLYPRDYKVPSPPLRPEPADDDGRWWNYNHQEQELDFGEMLALDRENVENLERPVCVPAASPPTGSKGRKARVLNKLSTKGRNKSERPKSVLTANLFSLRP